MGRFLLASAAFHAGLLVLAILLGLRGPSRPPLPPVYRVNLVAAAEVAPRRERPEPEPEEEVEEEPPPEIEELEEAEELPEPEDEPEPEPARPEPEETADASERTEREEGPERPLTLEGKPFPFPWYIERLVGKIERNWRPTSNTLEATVHFRIDARGRIGDVEVHESSGNFVFDRAARRAVEAADPLPPLPAGYEGDWLGVYFIFDTRVRAGS